MREVKFFNCFNKLGLNVSCNHILELNRELIALYVYCNNVLIC